ncbi:hypothetical protein IKE88_00885 [Candidatus Saccharibacteria bacterium]|nr:hypothetical protein [Candidatus Saccharibacteria bacterium]
MRVGVRMLEATHYHMSIQVTTTGLLVGFTARRCMTTTGHLLFIVVPLVTTCI